MQGQQQQQAYDRGITIFSPDGRLYQVEYAREAVKRGTASIGVRTNDGVVLAVDKRVPSPLLEDSSVEKIHKADDHVGIASGPRRRRPPADRLRPTPDAGQPAALRRAHRRRDADQGSHRSHPAVHAGRWRPTVRRRADRWRIQNGEPRLFETDPSGTPYEWKALAVGSDRGELQTYLEENYDDEADLDGGIQLALDALASVNDGSLLPSEVGLATIDAETESFEQFDQDRIADHLEENDLLDTGEDDEDEPGDESAE